MDVEQAAKALDDAVLAVAQAAREVRDDAAEQGRSGMGRWLVSHDAIQALDDKLNAWARAGTALRDATIAANQTNLTAVENALLVLVLTKATRAWLREHDPKALAQAVRSLGARDGQRRDRRAVDRVARRRRGAAMKLGLVRAS